jgi:hypothetical protein
LIELDRFKSTTIVPLVRGLEFMRGGSTFTARLDLPLHFHGWLQTLCKVSQLNLGGNIFDGLTILDKMTCPSVGVLIHELVLTPFLKIYQ